MKQDIYEHILTVKIPTLPPSVNEVYSGTEKKRVMKYLDNMTIGDLIIYWREDAVELIKEAMKKHGINKCLDGCFRIDIGVSPRNPNRRYDIDNFLKIPIDAIEKAGLFKDDVAVVEVFGKRLPLNHGVIISVFKIHNRNIYEYETGKEAYSYNVPKVKSLYAQLLKMTKVERIEKFLNEDIKPNKFIPLGIVTNKSYNNNYYVEYMLDDNKYSELIRVKNNKNLIEELQKRKADKEKELNKQCSFKLIDIKDMTYSAYMTKIASNK